MSGKAKVYLRQVLTFLRKEQTAKLKMPARLMRLFILNIEACPRQRRPARELDGALFRLVLPGDSPVPDSPLK